MMPNPSPAAQPFADEFDRLMQRAHLELKPEWREPMLAEFAEMRAELEAIHSFADTRESIVDLRQVITYGRIEK
ncbi:hypothetical protein ACXIUS_26350 [Bosea thiooxidans]